MQIQSHILNTIKVFKVEDSLKDVIQFFKDTTYSHAAIVEGERFLGVLSEEDLENFKEGKMIGDYRYNLESFFVRKETLWLDVLETFARNDANLIPVLNENEKVMGYYNLSDVVGEFIDTPFFKEPGGILVVEKGLRDYSFSEVAQIVETNNARLIGGFITDMHNDVAQITLKISTTDLNEVTQTFRRYNYNILFGNSDDQFLEDLKQRSDYLDKYLNV